MHVRLHADECPPHIDEDVHAYEDQQTTDASVLASFKSTGGIRTKPTNA
jgi:hypothetical protein